MKHFLPTPERIARMKKQLREERVDEPQGKAVYSDRSKKVYKDPNFSAHYTGIQGLGD